MHKPATSCPECGEALSPEVMQTAFDDDPFLWDEADTGFDFWQPSISPDEQTNHARE